MSAASLLVVDDIHAAYQPGVDILQGMSLSVAPGGFMLVIGPNGEVLYQSLGSLDALEIRRTLLRNFPDDEYIGVAEYFRQAQAEFEARKK